MKELRHIFVSLGYFSFGLVEIFFFFFLCKFGLCSAISQQLPRRCSEMKSFHKEFGKQLPIYFALGRFIIHISISKPLSPSMVEKKILFNSFNNISQMLLKMNNIWLNMNNRWLKKPAKQMFQRALFSVTCCLFMWIHNVFLFEHLLRLQRLQLSVSEPRLRFLDLKWS